MKILARKFEFISGGGFKGSSLRKASGGGVRGRFQGTVSKGGLKGEVSGFKEFEIKKNHNCNQDRI